MTAISYLDFDLSIEALPQAPGRYRARVYDSLAAGQARVEFTLPFSDLEVENFFLRIGRPRRGVRFIGSPEMLAAQTFGGKLFAQVFTGQVQNAFQRNQDRARQQGQQGVRIRLRLSDAPALADLPWEFLYDPGQNHFLAYSTATPIVRYLDLPQGVTPLAAPRPLQVLVMIANPRDHGYGQLDVEAEWRKVQGALADLERRGLVQVTRLETATLSALQRHLRRGQYHIFHFVGHGGFDQQSQSGVLLLEDEQGRSRLVSGHTLGALLRDHFSLRLALLNACEGARTSRADPFAGVAQHLVQQGIPAVIAMQFEITDAAAITLAHEFYNALADAYPVDAALAEARKALYTGGNDIEWGTPVLYMRAQDGYLFDAAALAQAQASRAPATSPVQAVTQSEPPLLVQDVKPLKEQLAPVSEPAQPAVTAKPEAETVLPQARTPTTVQTEAPSTPKALKDKGPVAHDEERIAQKDKRTFRDEAYKLAPGAAPAVKKGKWWKIVLGIAGAVALLYFAIYWINSRPPKAVAVAFSPQVTPVVSGTLWTNGGGFNFVYVPAGKFLMGSESSDDEKPVHEMVTDDFWIMQTEITNAQYAAFVEAGGYQEKNYWTEAGWNWRNSNNITYPQYWYDARFNDANQPVVGVSWYEAVAYAKWLSEKTNQVITLPTEAQWEKAARGTQGLVYPWGNEWESSRANAYGSNDGYEYTAPVGSYPNGKSPYNALDMAGNVWEWTATKWVSNYENYANIVDNTPDGDAARSLRGGGWYYYSLFVRAAYRLRQPELSVHQPRFSVGGLPRLLTTMGHGASDLWNTL